jgi:hypothetical protein
MPKIELPGPLDDLLEGSSYRAPILALADRVSEILADNALRFFPDYTDHGSGHVSLVLRTEVELIPREVWKETGSRADRRRPLRDADAAVLIGATLLHDIGMHLRVDGFRELVGKASRFKPLEWFDKSQQGHSADIPWHQLWEDYEREARRFSDRQLTNIVGEKSARVWKYQALPEDEGQWELNHFLIVGEFIRRHHARLAHEIAIYGWTPLERGHLVRAFYVGLFERESVEVKPRTLVAKLWNECLGANAIPFDSALREQLISQGSQHPDLQRHIASWKALTDTGTKWVSRWT